MSTRNTPLGAQTLMFDDVVWDVPGLSPPSIDTDRDVLGPPAGVKVGLPVHKWLQLGLTPKIIKPPELDHPPYWEFTYQINYTSGLTLKNVVVRNTQGAGSTEPVFESIEFADLEVTFTDGSSFPFDLNRAFDPAGADFKFCENGTRTTKGQVDNLFQRGLKMEMVDNVLAGEGGMCKVRLELSFVFRGVANDFDPGGVPVDLAMWPEIGWTWYNEGATKRVHKFRGSVKVTVNNRMAAAHQHGSSPVPVANVVSFFADSNSSHADTFRALRDPRSWSVAAGFAFGWAALFDYNLLLLPQEREMVCVYGPGEGPQHQLSRGRAYPWGSRWLSNIPPQPPVPAPGVISLVKAPRQGYYDNIHLHARMGDPDDCGNEQVHAPFCGHSCVHLHWRWGLVSALPQGSLSGPGWRYRGWSNPDGGTPEAHTTLGAPLIPPNQRLVIAICRPGATRVSHHAILGTPQPLDPLHKLIWYQADVREPKAGQRQVIFSHPIGWAYRYSTHNESMGVALLSLATNPALLLNDNPSQHDMTDFFVEDVYPVWRYFLGGCNNQVPDGGYAPQGTSMEAL
jgi:hypothetical protein